MKATTIYGLVDPRSSELRYVGKTVKSLVVRLGLHIWQAENVKCKRHVLAWVSGLLAAGMKPEIVEIEIVPAGADWVEAECFWIAYFRSLGAKLCNLTVGGDGAPGNRWTPEQKARLVVRRGADHPRFGHRDSAQMLAAKSERARQLHSNPQWREYYLRRQREGVTPEIVERAKARLIAYRSDPARFEEMQRRSTIAKQKPEFRAAIGVWSKSQWAANRDGIIAAQNAGKGDDYRRKQSELKKAQWQDPDSGMWEVFLTPAERDEIRSKLTSGMTGTAVAKLYGLSQSRISQIRHGA